MIAPVTLFLTLLLAVSSVHKALQRERLAVVAARLIGVAPALGLPLLIVAASVEMLAAIALLAGPAPVGGGLAAALWSTYAVALWRRRGERLDCGCDFVRRERPVGIAAIARPALLAAMALGSLSAPFAWTADAPFAALALLALWLAASELSTLPQLARNKS